MCQAWLSLEFRQIDESSEMSMISEWASWRVLCKTVVDEGKSAWVLLVYINMDNYVQQAEVEDLWEIKNWRICIKTDQVIAKRVFQLPAPIPPIRNFALLLYGEILATFVDSHAFCAHLIAS